MHLFDLEPRDLDAVDLEDVVVRLHARLVGAAVVSHGVNDYRALVAGADGEAK